MAKKCFSILIIMAVAIMFFAGCSSNNEYKYIITYEAETNSINEKQISDAKEIVIDRFKAMNYENVTAEQEGNNKLRVEVSGDELAKEQAELVGRRNEIRIVGPEERVIITNEDIIDSVSQQDPKTKTSQVLVKFTQDGKEKLATATAKYIGKQIKIYLDDEIVSAPVVQAVITDGETVITGNMDDEEAKELAAIIKEKKPLPFLFKVIDMSKE